ncbi:MAG: MOSC domain-containing protein [Anaerolineae bacterium]
MPNSGTLEAIWLKRMKGGPMDPQQQAGLKANAGLVGNANQGGKRQVTIIEKERWEDIMAAMGADLDPAARRANIMVSGISLANSRGQVLQIGNCRIKIYGETTPCSHLDDALPGLQDAMRGNWSGGVFGEVLDDGEITVGDEVRWVA